MEWDTDPRLMATFAFLVRLIALSAPLYLVLLFVDLFPLQLAVASASAALLHGLGYGVIQDGALMAVGDFSFFISPDSTGWKSMLFLAALVIAVPRVPWARRALGLAVGVPLIVAGNLGRVLAIVAVEGSYGLEAALFTHDVLWRFGLVALVLGIWGVWFWRAREAGTVEVDDTRQTRRRR